jgi:hypothetical protein
VSSGRLACGEKAVVRSVRSWASIALLRPSMGARGSRKVGSIYGVDLACAITNSPSIEPAFSAMALMKQGQSGAWYTRALAHGPNMEYLFISSCFPSIVIEIAVGTPLNGPSRPNFRWRVPAISRSGLHPVTSRFCGPFPDMRSLHSTPARKCDVSTAQTRSLTAFRATMSGRMLRRRCDQSRGAGQG